MASPVPFAPEVRPPPAAPAAIAPPPARAMSGGPLASCLPPPAHVPLLPSVSSSRASSAASASAGLGAASAVEAGALLGVPKGLRRVPPRVLLAVAGLAYGLLMVLVAKHAGMGRSADGRRKTDSKSEARLETGYQAPPVVSGDVWSDYFALGNQRRVEMPYDEFAEALRAYAIVEHPPDGLNLTRRAAAAIAPYVDMNHDHKVGKGELFAFVGKFAGGEPDAARQDAAVTAGEYDEAGEVPNVAKYDPKRLGNAVASALQLVAAAGSTPGAGDASGGCSLHFSRKRGNYVELVNSGGLQFGGSQPFTIEMWVRPTIERKKMCLISKYNRGKWGQYYVSIDDTGRVFFHREVAPWGQRSDRKLPVNSYTHVTVTFRWDDVRQRGESSIYLNGTVSASQREGPQDNNPETAILIGALQESSLPADHFDGDIDDVRMWDVHKTAKDVQDSMRLRLTGMEEHLVGYWSMDECRGAYTRDALGHHDGSLRETVAGGDKSAGLGMWRTSGVSLRSYSDHVGCLDALC